MKPEEKTTITVSKDTKARLGELGTAKDTLNDVIVHCLNFYERHGG